ncbi:hypothetical protein [Paenibacillus sp. 1001270B_150601_E10]|uniref:hypothetical protein n=1 Tax=Paenibacillus sp. 1001270B_150601_E10 TaxID=2787079 RepID=UPI00189F1DA4|nr:hypothetical protein [Paenibacillus sp. 1001270B_150601_E10]
MALRSKPILIHRKQLINSVSRFIPSYDKVVSIAKEESVSFFRGQKSAEEAAKLIQNRISTYLNE